MGPNIGSWTHGGAPLSARPKGALHPDLPTRGRLMSQVFVDYAHIHFRAGDGGHGCCSFRREKHVPRGGPDGGDGGDGGSIWLRATARLGTLLDLKLKPSIKARRGDHGGGNQRSGRNGADIVIEVPLGTLVYDEHGALLADLTEQGECFRAAEGGRGGLGNQHFATSTNQAPRKTTPGRPGQERNLILELKLIAHAGLIGLPNAGKSTLLNRLTRATARVAAYPFTTLHPNLGVMEVDPVRRVTLADLPGLIEGASSGGGLGDRFLRHIERTALLIHLIAPPEADPEHPGTDAIETIQYSYRLIREELKAYSSAMTHKPEIVALTKIDRLDPHRLQIYLGALRELDVHVLPISAQTGAGLPELETCIVEKLETMGVPLEERVPRAAEIQPEPQRGTEGEGNDHDQNR